jgi:large subunit ribosomal protein L13
MRRTPSQSAEAALDSRTWFIVDAKDQVVGRLASQLVKYLRGKIHACHTSHVDGGAYVIIINAGAAKFTGTKLRKKLYHRHTGWVGGIRTLTAEKAFETDPTLPMRRAVHGMMPKGNLGRHMEKKLKIYAGSDHGHAAQKPQTLTFPDAAMR